MNDSALKSFDSSNNGQTVEWAVPLGGMGYTDTIHCSALEDFKGDFTSVYSGSEDALDCNNRCRSVSMHANIWSLDGKVGITIKGGSEQVAVSGMVNGTGKVELGGWSDQSHERTTGVRLNLTHVDGSSIPVRVLLADAPVLEGGPYHYLFPNPHGLLHGFWVWWFMTLRRWGFFR